VIHFQADYELAQRQLARDLKAAHEQERQLSERGLTPEQLERGAAPLRVITRQLEQEIAEYERARRQRGV
jgi:hypothetical protein